MIYLKATDQETFNAALKTTGWSWDTEYRVETDEEGNETFTEEVIKEAGMTAYSHTHSLDVIGIIHAPTGETETRTHEDGTEFEVPVMMSLDGYHANLLLHGEELPEALADMVIEAPNSPVRRFA
jgi:hypothetical protein